MLQREIEKVLDELRPRIGPWRKTWPWPNLGYSAQGLRLGVQQSIDGPYDAFGVSSKRTGLHASLCFNSNVGFSAADVEELIDLVEGIRKTRSAVEGGDE